MTSSRENVQTRLGCNGYNEQRENRSGNSGVSFLLEENI